MRISKLYIENYKRFKGGFSLDFTDGINIIVGDNEAGKSTVLEAINLALTGVLHGRYLKNELSQYLFNFDVVNDYLSSIRNGEKPLPPAITIEVHFDDCNLPIFEGNLNSDREKSTGVLFKVEFDEQYKPLYEALLNDNGELQTIPIEYYKVDWKSFAREAVNARVIPVKSVLIDSSSNRYQNGSDVYISRIIRNDLEDYEKVGLSQAYRKMKDSFINDPSIQSINKKVNDKTEISNKNLSISVDLSTQNSWETTLMTYLDDVPFHQIGKGEQCIVKTSLALSHNKSQEANLVLLEEPENHLSHTKLNQLIRTVTSQCEGKQVIMTTHSSYVANKLGLENLILMHDQQVARLKELDDETFNFFKKLPGYQTLRLVLCRKAVLVEGDSDELIFQKLYMMTNGGRLPIEDGIDVISVKLTFKRFLNIANLLNKSVAVITDNDGDFDKNISQKYADYLGQANISIFSDTRNNLNTLEPQFVDANNQQLDKLRSVLGISNDVYDTEEKVSKYMENNKTKWALKVFETEEGLNFPTYLVNSVGWCND